MMIAAGVFVCLLLLEFFALMSGISVMFKKANAIQVLLHGLGVLSCVWMILDRFSYVTLYVIAFLFGFLPFLIEIFVFLSAVDKFRRIGLVEQELKSISARHQKLLKERTMAQIGETDK